MHCEFKQVRWLTTALAATFLLLGTRLSHVAAQQPERALVFRNVDMFDGTRMTRRTIVLVRDGLIRAVGTDIAIPSSAQVIDGIGKTLLPALFDAHTHLGAKQGELFLRNALDFGIATELEMWGSDASLALRKKMGAADSADIADFRTAGIGITVPRGHPTQMGGPPFPTIAPDDNAQTFVDARIAEGSDHIKIIYEHTFPTLTRQQIEDVVAAAHRRNKVVVVHNTTQSDAREAIAAGADGLAHIFADSPPEPGFAEFAAQHHVFVIPTLTVVEALTVAPGKPWWQDDSHVGPYITPSMKRTLDVKVPSGFGAKLKLAHAEAAVGALHRAGVPILAGTDAPGPGLAHGLSLHRELELLVKSGLRPLEALASATFEPARAFGFRDRGRIAVGLRADLLLVNGDPTAAIPATRDIVGIWKLGVPHPRDSADGPSEKK
jgi:imidazolonepropionase-like amidohydrolase